MNSELCSVQRTLVQHFALQDRIQVIEGEMCTRPDLLVSHILSVNHNQDKIILKEVFLL
jgi:hypothetical protein